MLGEALEAAMIWQFSPVFAKLALKTVIAVNPTVNR
jgi:hypothetical protein